MLIDGSRRCLPSSRCLHQIAQARAAPPFRSCRCPPPCSSSHTGDQPARPSRCRAVTPTARDPASLLGPRAAAPARLPPPLIYAMVLAAHPVI